MKTITKKKLISGAIVLTLCMVALPAFATGSTNPSDFGGPDMNNMSSTFGGKQLNTIIPQLITIVMGLLGVVAVLLVLWGGFQWMTAGGEPDKVGKAKKIIYSGLIGLIIIFMAWAIANFVFSMIINVTGANVNGTAT